MCADCDELSEPLTFRTPTDYVSFVRQLVTKTSAGKLLLIYGDCALEELNDSPPWPTGDVIRHELQCARCKQLFKLSVNVWNGRNSWGPQNAEDWARESVYYIKPLQ